MPHPLELPRMLRAVVKLVRGERLAGLGRRVVRELVALAFGHAVRGSRFPGRRSGLVPGFSAIVGALNDLAEPTTRLRSVYAIGIGERSFHVIHLPARKMGPADVPFFALAV